MIGAQTSSFLFSYDPETGVFTVPPSGDGFYFFSFYALTDYGELSTFDIRLNNEEICAAYGDMADAGGDYDQATCTAVVYAAEGIRCASDFPFIVRFCFGISLVASTTFFFSPNFFMLLFSLVAPRMRLNYGFLGCLRRTLHTACIQH